MHVLLITQYFPPEIGAAASRWGDYVNILINKGHKVTVLCEMPNYPYGRFIDGYKNECSKREKLSENLTIIRSGVWANDRKSTLKLLGNYLSFAFIGIVNAIKIKNYELIILSSPPLFVGLIGIVLNKIKTCSILLDLRDIWPESAVALGKIKSKSLIKMGRWLETKVYNAVNGFIFPVPGFSNYFKKSFPDQLDKPMFTLMNGIDSQFLVKSDKHNISRNNLFTVLYSGNMGIAQGLEVVIETAEMLANYPINFQFIGDGVNKESLVDLTNSKGINNVSFQNPLPRNQLIQEMKKANVCLVPLKNKKLFKLAIPSKIFEIMACSKPIILGVKGEAAEIIKQNNCGTIVSPENPVHFKKAILSYYNNVDLAKEHGQNGVNFVTGNMQKESLLSEFLIQIKNQKKALSI